MKELNIKDFDEIFNILEKSFPTDEIRTYNEQKALFDNPHYKVFGEMEENIKAVMAVWNFDGFLFLEHFTVSAELRNKGLGDKLLSEFLESCNKMVCLEVEPPENEISIRRIEFYKRCGFFFNNFNYIQPAISKGKSEIPLFIMTSRTHLTRAEFEAVKNILYKDVYKIDNIN